MEEFPLGHRFEKIEKGTDIVTVGGKIVGVGEIDDLASITQSAETACDVNAAGRGHEDIQNIQIKSALFLPMGEQRMAAGEQLHLSV